MGVMGGRDSVILLVEDNVDDIALTMRALERANIANEVLVAHDGAEAIEQLFGRYDAGLKAPALILLDLNLPKISGLEVLRTVRSDERSKLIPTVILTSSAEQEDILAGYSHGANAYVRKPVKFSEFVAAVSTLGMFWLLLNESAPEKQGTSEK